MAEESVVEFPFAAEYAKSGRSSCKVCKGSIEKGSLRLAVMVQSPMFDGKMANWYHFPCFFERNRLKTEADVKNFDNLRWEDQEKIKKKIVPHGEGGVQSNTDVGDSLLKDYCMDTAKSARSVCRGCNEKIAKGVVRISKKDYESDRAKRFGPVDQWYHLQCFVDKRQELEFYAAGNIIPGFKSLELQDQNTVLLQLPPVLPIGKGTKRPTEASYAGGELPKKKKVDSKEEDMLKAQNKLVFEFRDQLQQQQLSKKELLFLLEHNDQEVPVGESRLLEAVSDCMAFGALIPCPECKNGQLKVGCDIHFWPFPLHSLALAHKLKVETRTGGYKCTGNISEWTKCLYVTKTPERNPFLIPEELRKKYPFLKAYKYKKRDRLYRTNEAKPSAMQRKDSVDGATKPLAGMAFCIVGNITVAKEELKNTLRNLGGRVTDQIEKNLLAVISTQGEMDKKSKQIKAAKKANVHVVSEDFVDEVKKGNRNVQSLIVDKSICSWGGDLSDKIKRTKSGKDMYTKNVPTVQKMTVKGGATVNPDSGLVGTAHVLVRKTAIYNAVLGMVDVSKGLNSHYQLQILESDKGNKFWVFRAWGRIGTTIGGNKLDKMSSVDEAKELFEELYEEKTGNKWSNRANFVKRPHGFYPVDIDYGEDETVKRLKDIKSKTPSKLHQAVQDLICLIFDVEMMKSAMMEFELDLVKMPLGKLSRRQIEQGYSILTELQQMIQSKGSHGKFLDGSNKFYTLIPHNFGMKMPPLLNNEDLINSKIEMLDSLLEIELAYNLLKGSTDEKMNPIDSHYAKLKVDIETLEEHSTKYEMLQTYLQNTHAATHNQYSLQIRNLFEVKRHGEAARYKPFKKLPNQMLLWHGSRISNYVGILSQGLKIAPSEAPVTGYMFGKGIYFADMVSKSANYCHSSKEHHVGLLLLCDVALGNMHELKNAAYIEKLPTGKHSTKGLGATQPDPSQQVEQNGVIIPLGKPVASGVKNTSLLYNEYIVYDIAQVNVKYLVEVDFKWKF